MGAMVADRERVDYGGSHGSRQGEGRSWWEPWQGGGKGLVWLPESEAGPLSWPLGVVISSECRII